MPDQDISERLPIQIWTALPDGALDFVTEQTARQFGVTAETLLRDGWQNVVHPEDLPTAGARWGHSLQTGEPYEVEFRVRLANGNYAWHLVRAVAQRDAAGAIVRWYGTNTNIERERESQRRVNALLEEVTAQAREYETTVRGLRAELTATKARVDELERSRPRE